MYLSESMESDFPAHYYCLNSKYFLGDHEGRRFQDDSTQIGFELIGGAFHLSLKYGEETQNGQNLILTPN